MITPMILEGETCPICLKKTLRLQESSRVLPSLGTVFEFSMDCVSCKYRKADVEVEGVTDPVSYVFEVKSEEDLNVVVVKSSEATVKIPRFASLEPGPSMQGEVTTVGQLIEQMKAQAQAVKNAEDDSAARKRAKNLMKKLSSILAASLSVKISVSDPSGNSAILSNRAVKK